MLCWAFIVIFYGRQYVRIKQAYPLIATLLVVLFIDGSRSLIESVFFGAKYTADAGLLPPQVFIPSATRS